MGLEARVYTSSERLPPGVDLRITAIDPHTGEVTIDSDQQFIAADKLLGNAAMIAWLLEQMAGLVRGIPKPLLVTKILYNGTHSGDMIHGSDFSQLKKEIQVVRKNLGVGAAAPEIDQFLSDLEDLIGVAEEQDNPIVFV